MKDNIHKVLRIDQMGRAFFCPEKPKRIISLVPSQTELLHYLGLEKEVVGITKFCIHPEDWFQNKKRIGGTKNINIEVINALEPDLIIGNKEENTKENIELLTKSYPVWMSDINTLEDALQMILEIGNITQTTTKAETLVNQIKSRITTKVNQPLQKAIYLIWKDPYMTVGKNTFINDMLRYAGFENIILDDRYPEITVEKIKQLNPEYLLLSSEPYPFKEEHIIILSKELPHTKVKIVDGEMFSWYGSRLLQSFEYFKNL